MIVKQLTDKLTKALTGTTVDNILSTSVENVNKTTQEGEAGGLTGLVKGFFDGLSGLMTGPFIIIGIIVIVLAILAYVFRGSISKILEKKAGAAFGKVLFGRKRRR